MIYANFINVQWKKHYANSNIYLTLFHFLWKEGHVNNLNEFLLES